MEELFNTYYNAFVQAISQRLKSEFGALVSFYPFDLGCVIIVDVKRDFAYRKEQKSTSSNLVEALVKTTYFDREKCNHLRDKVIADALIIVPSLSRYIILKNNKEEEWGADKAQNDVERLYSILKEKYGKK